MLYLILDGRLLMSLNSGLAAGAHSSKKSRCFPLISAAPTPVWEVALNTRKWPLYLLKLSAFSLLPHIFLLQYLEGVCAQRCVPFASKIQTGPAPSKKITCKKLRAAN